MVGEAVVHTGTAAVDADASRRRSEADARTAGPGEVASTAVDATRLLYLGRGRDHVEVHADADARLFLLGGEPFEADIVMWWNFVGRSHDEIVEAREAWEAHAERFGAVIDHGPERIPAPPLPGVRLTPRRRR